MRSLYLFFLIIFLLINLNSGYCEEGFLADYTIEGSAVGNTKLKGNLKIMSINNIKRVTSALFYQEAGNPFPALVENDLIVDYKSGNKYINSSDSGEWIKLSLKDEYGLIDERNFKPVITRGEQTVKINFSIDSLSGIGGKENYSIILNYSKSDSIEEKNLFQKFDKTSALDFLSFFIENEKVIELLNKNLINEKNRVVDNFKIRVEENNKVKMDVNGKLESKLKMLLTAEDFKF